MITVRVSVIHLQLQDEGIEAQQIAESIYKYIDENWVSGYPIIDELAVEKLDTKPFPMQGDYYVQ